MPTVEARREHYRGTVVIDHVAPGLSREIPQGLHERLGPADAQRQRRAARCCRAIPPRSFRGWNSGTRAKGRSPRSGRIRQRSRRSAVIEWMQEPCRSCERKEVDFGGCRCQAMALLGDAAACDPICTKSPHHTSRQRNRGARQRRRRRRVCAAALRSRAGLISRVNQMSDKDWTDAPKLSLEEFDAAIRAVGAERYHDKHPFHKLLHGGKLNKGQVQAWALNRYCYQEAVPRKDAALIAAPRSRELRREWVHRILDHDGFGDEPGGIERWLVLTDGLGLDRDYVDFQARRAAGDALRGRGLCALRRRGAADGRRRLVADGAVRAEDPSRAHLRHAGELRFHRRRRDGLFQAPARAGAARRRFRARLHQAQRPHARRAGGLRRRRALQVQRAVGAARRAASRLCRAGKHPARRLHGPRWRAIPASKS